MKHSSFRRRYSLTVSRGLFTLRLTLPELLASCHLVVDEGNLMLKISADKAGLADLSSEGLSLQFTLDERLSCGDLNSMVQVWELAHDADSAAWARIQVALQELKHKSEQWLRDKFGSSCGGAEWNTPKRYRRSSKKAGLTRKLDGDFEGSNEQINKY